MLLKGSGHFLSPDGERLAGTGDPVYLAGLQHRRTDTAAFVSRQLRRAIKPTMAFAASSEGYSAITASAAAEHIQRSISSAHCKAGRYGKFKRYTNGFCGLKENRGELRQLKNLLTASLLKALEPGALSGEADPVFMADHDMAFTALYIRGYTYTAKP